jgi:hypothetical protein
MEDRSMKFIANLNDTGRSNDDRFLVELDRDEIKHLVGYNMIDKMTSGHSDRRPKNGEEISTQEARDRHDENAIIASKAKAVHQAATILADHFKPKEVAQ